MLTTQYEWINKRIIIRITNNNVNSVIGIWSQLIIRSPCGHVPGLLGRLEMRQPLCSEDPHSAAPTAALTTSESPPCPGGAFSLALVPDRVSHSQAVWQEKWKSNCSPQQLCPLIPVTAIHSYELPTALPDACLPSLSSVSLCSSPVGSNTGM